MFKNKKLLFRIVFSYAILVIIIMGSISAVVSYSYSSFIFREKQNVYRQKLDIVSEQLNGNVQKINTLHSQIVRSYEVNKLIRDGSSPQTAGRQALAKLKADHYGVRAIYLYDENKKLLDYTADSLAGVPEFAGLEAFVESRAFRRFEKQGESLVYYGAIFLPGNGPHRYSAYVALVLLPERMYFNMNQKSDDTFDGLYLADGGTVISKYGAAGVDEELILDTPADERLRAGEKSYMVFKQRNSAYAEWKLIALVDYSEYIREIQGLNIMLLGLATMAVILIVIISFFISRRITRPISEINQAMIQVEQRSYPPALISRTLDEIDDLIQGFNHMVKSLKKLNADIIREQEEKRRYEVEKINAQLELLQSQINPHFIHNTLNALKYMALKAYNQELADTIGSFNTLLRASISTNTEFTTVEEECHYVMEYMNIQKIRYSSRDIECTYYVNAEAAEALLPRLILQPLVENSLFHGILPLENNKAGKIKIVCLVENNFLHVYITDNGIGITEDTIRRINSGELRVTNGYNHIGLNNVKERLNLMYNTDCRFIITSEYQSGTTIYFCVPYEEDA